MLSPYFPVGLAAALEELAGLIVPERVTVGPLVELRLSSYRIGWRLPFQVRQSVNNQNGPTTVDRPMAIERPDDDFSKGGSWWLGRASGPPSDLLALAAERYPDVGQPQLWKAGV